MKIQIIRSETFERQHGRCYYCGVPMWNVDAQAFARHHDLRPRQARQFQCTVEHLTPRQDGGQDTRSNIAAACLYCNHHRHAQRKVAPSPSAYRKHVQARLAKGKWHGWRLEPNARSTVETSHPGRLHSP